MEIGRGYLYTLTGVISELNSIDSWKWQYKNYCIIMTLLSKGRYNCGPASVSVIYFEDKKQLSITCTYFKRSLVRFHIFGNEIKDVVTSGFLSRKTGCLLKNHVIRFDIGIGHEET